ncbi:hypothetical protein D3C76_1071880 [compost metagenome]
MSESNQLLLVLAFFILIDRLIKPYRPRKWLGLTFLGGGLLGRLTLTESHWLGFDLHLVSLFAVVGGLELFFRRHRFNPDLWA